ncbi:hypothetical protein Dimus_008415, partial [Dionaea muscipula]
METEKTAHREQMYIYCMANGQFMLLHGEDNLNFGLEEWEGWRGPLRGRVWAKRTHRVVEDEEVTQIGRERGKASAMQGQ